MRITPPRYIVGIPSQQVCYQGNSKALAWLSWAFNRRSGAVAFDRLSWIINPSYWLRGEAPKAGFFGAATNTQN